MALSAFVAMGIVPLTIVILAIWRWNGTATELPAFQSSRTPWIFLGLASVAWVTVTVPAQIQLCRNFTFERLVTDGEIRAALDYMGQHQLRDFAPARTLPPKLYEWDSAERLARLLGELRCDDSTWIHKHLLHGIKVIVARQKNWQSQRDIETPLAADEVSSFRLSHGPDGAAWLAILHALDLSEEGRAYKARQTNLWAALSRESKAPPVTTGRSRKSEATQHADWLRLGEILRGLGHTNAVTSLIDNSAP